MMLKQDKKKQNRFVVEVDDSKKTSIIVYDKKTKLILFIKKLLSKFYHIYETTNPEYVSNKKIDLGVYINVFPDNSTQIKRNKKNIFVFIFNKSLYKKTKEWCCKNLKYFKVVHLGLSYHNPSELLDFIFFRTPWPYIFDYHINIRREFSVASIIRPKNPKDFFKSIIKWAVVIVFVLNTLYVFSLLIFAGILYSSAMNTNIASIKSNIFKIKFAQSTANTMSVFPKHTLFWLPGVKQILDFHEASNNSVLLIENGTKFIDAYTLLVGAITRQSQTSETSSNIELRIAQTRTATENFEQSIQITKNSWENINVPFMDNTKKTLINKLDGAQEYVSVLKDVIGAAPDFLGSKKRKKYLVLFMNNMELRPGGGFIGSVGVVELENYSLKTFRIYDIYSLDGQLKVHLDPPYPIRKYLGQPHWFLRDSNFSPDFLTNANQALLFVKQEVGWEGFDGVIGITLSSVQDLITAFPHLKLIDYNETITKDNFFIKAQSYIERDFFAGSKSKRNFLKSAVEAISLRIQDGDFDKALFGKQLLRLLDEKFIVLSFRDKPLAQLAKKYYWTGETTKPGCTIQDNCFSDYLSVIDANLGINKSNFFIQRSIRLRTTISSTGVVKNILILEYKNESQQNQFFGGVYKNYVQVYVPTTVHINQVLKSGSIIKNYNEKILGDYRVIGVWLEVPPQSQKYLQIEYKFGRKLKEKTTYQLIVQKQIGSINNDFIYEFFPTDRMSIKRANFPALVQSQGLVYNTFLEKDRILLISIAPQ